MSNRWVISWLVIDYWRWSISNRSPKILWPIDYSSMTHLCNWLLIGDPSITHQLLYCARKTLSLLSCTIFIFVCDSFICVRRIFSCICEVPVDDVERQSANHKYRWNIYRILHGKCVRTVVTHELWRIRNRTSERSERVRFLIQNNECVNTVQSTFHVVLCLLYTYWDWIPSLNYGKLYLNKCGQATITERKQLKRKSKAYFKTFDVLFYRRIVNNETLFTHGFHRDRNFQY